MKKFSFIAMLMALCTFAIACAPEAPDDVVDSEKSISVTPTQLVFTAEGGEFRASLLMLPTPLGVSNVMPIGVASHSPKPLRTIRS